MYRKSNSGIIHESFDNMKEEKKMVKLTKEYRIYIISSYTSQDGYMDKVPV